MKVRFTLMNTLCKKLGYCFYKLMAVIMKRWYRSRRNQVIIAVIVLSFLIYCTMFTSFLPPEQNVDITRRLIEKKLQEALKYDKGTGCEMPILDPFNEEVTQFDRKTIPIICKGKDWVKCYYSECKVVKEILDTTRDIVCTYRDIMYVTDQKYHLGSPIKVYEDNPYVLTRSDHVKIKCKGTHLYSIFPSKWIGVAAGFRKNISTIGPPPWHKNSINVLIFGYDSMSKNGFIRRMPKTYRFITEELKVTILHGYNIVGDGTPAALLPILTGTNELEMPDARKKTKNCKTIDIKNFIFYKLKQYGYRTAYFEDSPSIGTFQYRFNGFSGQPADHYLRAFYLEDEKTSYQKYCVGDTPRYRIMMNITDQLLNIPNTKRFIFTFISDITHDDFNMISNADDATLKFFKSYREKGRTWDTLLVFMGDHGTRYAPLRETLQGRLEERLPLMAILLPENIHFTRPKVQRNLELNWRVLTTPHDIHATILDVLDLKQYTPEYTIPGADLPRAMSLLQPIPKNRSCSEAGIEPHWCACVSWKPVLPEDPMYERAAQALLDYINRLTEPVRSDCVPRTLRSISWVMKQQYNKGLMEFKQSDADGYVPSYGSPVKPEKENYQVKMTVGPGAGVFEGTITYITKGDKFSIDSRDISRTNMYHHEPDCIHLTHPHLNMFCYCKNYLNSLREV